MNNTPHLWLRAEIKTTERRAAVDPVNAAKLISAGFRVSVERSSERIFKDDEYQQAGCDLVTSHSWPQAPANAYILGLKELAADSFPVTHRHIHFGHVYKQQHGWEISLSRFNAGGGILYDLEYLVDSNYKRIAAFGYWAGFAGAALALQAWAGQQLRYPNVLDPLAATCSQHRLVEKVLASLAQAQARSVISTVANDAKIKNTPKVLVMGAFGKSGQGAVECLKAVGIKAIEWDIEQTRAGGPFQQILDADIFINCVLVNRKIPAFLTNESLDTKQRNLTVLCDVSCDPHSELNPIPVYRECTSFQTPTRLLRKHPALHLISIDHLPSLLPRESSEDFANQLFPSLLGLRHIEKAMGIGLNLDEDDQTAVWVRAEETYRKILRQLNP